MAIGDTVSRIEKDMMDASLDADWELFARKQITTEIYKLFKISSSAVDAVSKARLLLSRVLAGEDLDDQVIVCSTKPSCMTIGCLLVLALWVLVMSTLQARNQKHVRDGIAYNQIQFMQLQSQFYRANKLRREEMGFLGSVFDHFEQAGNTLGERIDFIWESLGPPNANGNYYTVTETNNELTAKDGSEQKMRLVELSYKLKALERYIKRIDLRLTNQIDILKKREK